jgi:hypothetical protein
MSETPPRPPISPVAPISCAEVRPYLSAYADGELAEPLRSQIARHLAGCAECAARVGGYRSIDALLASLPATAPSPEVFHTVMAAAREQNAEPVERETLASPFAGLASRRLHVVRPEPRQQDIPALPGARRKSWIATVAPAIAAVLLISLAALAFRGLVMAPHNTNPASTPTISGTILEQTQAQVDEVTKATQLPFTPVMPTYAPDGSSSVQVSVGPNSANVIYLDILWTVTSNRDVSEVRIREVKSGYDYYGYTPDSSDGAATWKLTAGRVWEELKNDSVGQVASLTLGSSVAAGERRGNELSLAVEVTGTSPSTSADSLKATLRQVTLSMDSPNKPIPLTARPPTGLVLHYKAQSRVTGGETPAWSAEAYVNPATDAQRVAVSANGKPRYVDVSQGAQAYRLDTQTNTYATGPRSQFSGEMNPDANGNDNVLQIFRDPYTLLQSGLLWYSGQNAKIGSANVYDYILVSAPNETHVYIDQQAKQVVKMEVKPAVVWSNPPDTLQVYGKDGCSYFTLIEYMQPEGVPAGTFSLTPPSDSHQDQSHVPATVTCS